VSCARIEPLLNAWVDDELDARSLAEVEEHLASCRSCSEAQARLRELHERAREQLRVYTPSPALVSRLQAALRVEAGLPAAPSSEGAQAGPISSPLVTPVRLSAALTPAGSPRVAPAPLPGLFSSPRLRRAALALAGPALAAGVLLGVFATRRAADDARADAVTAAHVRSLLASHLTDVASSDQHTVKPWFQGKLDYSVTVTDLAEEGYPLVGGRLDYIEDAPAAALVYKRRQHVVNLFIWPSKEAGRERQQPFTRRGYHAFRWAKDGMAYWAISDLNEAELEKFVQLVQR
jgi:anti-sigma factor RsiW